MMDYCIETDAGGTWTQNGLGEERRYTYTTVANGARAIRALMACGPDWQAAAYRLRGVDNGALTAVTIYDWDAALRYE